MPHKSWQHGLPDDSHRSRLNRQPRGGTSPHVEEHANGAALAPMGSTIVCALDNLLLPRGLGPRPWTHARYRAVMQALDNSAFVFMVLNNWLGHVAASKFPPTRDQQRAVKLVPALFYIGAGLLQQLASRRWPDSYYRHRHHIVAFLRLARMPCILLLPFNIRRWLLSINDQPAATAYDGAHSPRSKPLLAVVCLLGLSGGIHTLMHTTAVPLPLLPQAVFQLLYLLLLVPRLVVPAAAGLDRTPFMGEVRGMCRALNSALTALYSPADCSQLQLPQLDQPCNGSAASQVMVLFTQLYGLFVLPLYYSYRLEQECRQRIQQTSPAPRAGAPGGASLLGADTQAPLMQQQAPPDTAALVALLQQGPQNDMAWVALHDCVVLLVIAMLCWVAALVAQPFVALVAWPLPAPLQQ